MVFTMVTKGPLGVPRRNIAKHGVKLKNRSEAQKNALKKGVSKIPTQGHKRSEKEKLRISKSMKKRWEDMDSEEYKEYVNRARDRWYSMSESERHSLCQAATKAIQKAGKEGSKLEIFIRQELSKHGFVVEAHKKNLIPNENLEIDNWTTLSKWVLRSPREILDEEFGGIFGGGYSVKISEDGASVAFISIPKVG